MNEAERICDEIRRALPHLKCGTLRFWGVWFGRPHDNIHRIVNCESNADVLRLHFVEGERLTIWYPQRYQIDSSIFRVLCAERVLWEWFYYGRPKTQTNLFFYDFVKTGDTVVASSNVNSYTPDLRTDFSMPAAEIL
jgi:hypothetical protein